MKEFKIVAGKDTCELQEQMNKAAKEGFDLVPHKKLMVKGDPAHFIVFMERTISETPQTEAEFKKFLEEHNDSGRIENEKNFMSGNSSWADEEMS